MEAGVEQERVVLVAGESEMKRAFPGLRRTLFEALYFLDQFQVVVQQQALYVIVNIEHGIAVTN